MTLEDLRQIDERDLQRLEAARRERSREVVVVSGLRQLAARRLHALGRRDHDDEQWNGVLPRKLGDGRHFTPIERGSAVHLPAGLIRSGSVRVERRAPRNRRGRRDHVIGLGEQPIQVRAPLEPRLEIAAVADHAVVHRDVLAPDAIVQVIAEKRADQNDRGPLTLLERLREELPVLHRPVAGNGRVPEAPWRRAFQPVHEPLLVVDSLSERERIPQDEPEASGRLPAALLGRGAHTKSVAVGEQPPARFARVDGLIDVGLERVERQRRVAPIDVEPRRRLRRGEPQERLPDHRHRAHHHRRRDALEDTLPPLLRAVFLVNRGSACVLGHGSHLERR